MLVSTFNKQTLHSYADPSSTAQDKCSVMVWSFCSLYGAVISDSKVNLPLIICRHDFGPLYLVSLILHFLTNVFSLSFSLIVVCLVYVAV